MPAFGHTLALHDRRLCGVQEAWENHTSYAHMVACMQGILSKLSAAKELLAELASREKKKMAEREAEKKAMAEAEEKKKQTADAVPT